MPYSRGPHASWQGYLVAVVSTSLALAARIGLDPVLGDRAPFLLPFAAVLLAAWFGGRGPSLLALAMSGLGIPYFLLAPRGSLEIADPSFHTGFVLYLLLGVGAVWLIDALHRARRLADERGRLWHVTLRSIGDGVVATDVEGRVTFLNGVAERLTGWSDAEARGQPLETVFRIVNEGTRLTVESPVTRALREGRIVGLANHTLLLARDGTERPIADSAAPILDPEGRSVGCVLVFRDVSEAADGDQRRRLLTDQIADGVFLATPEGRYVDANPAGCAMFGRTRAEMLDTTFADVLPPEEFPRVPAVLAAMADGNVHRAEWRFVRKDGSMFVGELLGRQLPDGMLQGVVRDVSERKRAEELIAATAATMEQLVANNPFGVYVVDADFRLHLVSRGAAPVFRTIQPVIGRDFAEVLRQLWTEPFASTVITRFRHTLATGEPYESGRTVERRADIDAVEAYDWHIERVRLADGRHGVACFFYDLTERSVWEQRLRVAADVAELGFHRWDIVADRVEWDERIRSWWRVGRDEPITLATFEAGVHPEDLPLVRQRIAAALDPAGTGLYEAEYRIQPPGTSLRWIRAVGRVEFLDGRAVAMTGAAIDITRDRQQTAALAAMDRRKDRFLATLSHELRNPLAPIRTATELLAHPDAAATHVRWAHDIIARQLRHLTRLLDDLLDVARITQGKMELRPEAVALAELVETAVETVRPALTAKRHALSIVVPPEPVVLHVDPFRLSQVLTNLLGNAVRYTEPGGHITLEATCRGHDLRIVVRDTGIGLTPEALATVFDMYAQVAGDHRAREGGLGIGLALARGLVELHGGQLDAASAGPGLGSEFTVTLPGRIATNAATAEPVAPATSHAERPRRVLIADDNRDAADSLAELLRLRGHEVSVAHGGRAALTLADTVRPDAVLLDLGMPDLDGFTVAAELRRQPWAADCLLVAISGWGQAPDRDRATEAGFAAHLTKPAAMADIEALLARREPAPASPAPPGLSARDG
jgi:PAS domain S-box-containing protein